MKNDLKRLVPWLAVPLLLAVLALVRPELLFGSPLERKPAPDFTFEIVAGEGLGDRVALAQQRGRVVVLDFWASWCMPCRESVPVLNHAAARFRDAPVSFYGVNVEAELGPRRLASVHQAFGSVFPTGQDRSGELQRAFRVSVLPTLVVIDREGRVRRASGGVPTEIGLESLITDLLTR